MAGPKAQHDSPVGANRDTVRRPSVPIGTKRARPITPLLLRLGTDYESMQEFERADRGSAKSEAKVAVCSPCLLREFASDNSEIAVAEPVIDHLLPFVGQRAKRPEAVVASRI